MKYLIFYWCFVIYICLQSGCTNVKVVRVQELLLVKNHVDSLKTELTQLQDQIIKEQKKQSELLRLMRATQQVNFNELDRKINILAGNISESQDRLSKIDKKTLEIKKRWEEKARSDSLVEFEKTAEVENMLNIALNDFTAGQYEIALNGFEEIINKYPESSQAEDSYYWIAESYYARKKYVDATTKYKHYIKTYNNGSKVCVALFKLGLIYDRMKQKKARKMVWNKLLTQCPNSEEAEAVRAKMN